jgi:predicted nucleic acid-binding protein
VSRFLIDTSCIIARLNVWHEHHAAASDEIERRLDAGEELIAAAHSLVESYSVLTRLPPRHRLTPDTARYLLDYNFGTFEAVALDAAAYRALVRAAPERMIVGGRIYDALILACALAARADTLLTFNDRHFRPLAGDGIEIVVPQEDPFPSDSQPAPG